MPALRSRKAVAPPDRPDWKVEQRVKLAGHRTELAPGVEFSVVRKVGTTGKVYRTRLTFRRYVTNLATGYSWLDAWDGRQLRSVDPAKVETVHRTRKVSTRSIDRRAS